MSVVIKVDGLSKKYIIRHEKKGVNHSFREAITESIKGFGKAMFGFGQKGSRRDLICEEFWALKNICFEISQGERIGIIGRNGAGKSTILKLLSRITEPTTGSIKIKGRVSSLLEVGTGFHHELTGKENIYLNGAILGMNKTEIDGKFDQIVTFAGIDRFLDTPDLRIM